MNEFYTKYIVNISKPEAEVQLIDGQINIAIGGWAGLTRNEVDHPDIISALRKKWIKIQDIQPKGEAEPEIAGPVISNVESVQGSATVPSRTKQVSEGTTLATQSEAKVEAKPTGTLGKDSKK